MNQFKIGTPVLWTDPDAGLCSGPGKITQIKGDRYVVAKDDGGLVEAPASELQLLTDDPADQAGNISEDEDTSPEPFAHVSDRETQP